MAANAARLAYIAAPGMEPDPTPDQLPYLRRFEDQKGVGEISTRRDKLAHLSTCYPPLQEILGNLKLTR